MSGLELPTCAILGRKPKPIEGNGLQRFMFLVKMSYSCFSMLKCM